MYYRGAEHVFHGQTRALRITLISLLGLLHASYIASHNGLCFLARQLGQNVYTSTQS